MNVQDTEETLADGTVVRRRVTKTRQKQTIVKRVVMEGPEDELPTSEEQAQARELQESRQDISPLTDQQVSGAPRVNL